MTFFTEASLQESFITRIALTNYFSAQSLKRSNVCCPFSNEINAIRFAREIMLNMRKVVYPMLKIKVVLAFHHRKSGNLTMQ